MSRSIRRLWLLAIAFAACVSAPAGAWGPVGHEIVAEIAARQLTPAATTMVEDLLGDRAGPALREASSWADKIRADPQLGITAPYHYINFPRGTCTYVAGRDCPGGRCVVSALERFTLQLREGDTRQARIAGLKWALHLTADVHQPLHAGIGEDRGGNDIQVRFEGKGTNLHALLDSQLLGTRDLRAVPYANFLMDGLDAPAAARVRWSIGAPVDWAEESCREVGGLYPPDRQIQPEFAERTRELLEERLLLAGHRLAQLLNAAATP
jgi:hypothetical protein